MRLPSRPSRAATLALAAAVLGACQDRPQPLPSEPTFALAGSAPACDHRAVILAVNRLYPGGSARAAAHREFNGARQHALAGRTDEATRAFLALAGDVLERYVGGRLLAPGGAEAAAQAVARLTDELYACAGLPLVSDPHALVELPVGDPSLLDVVAVPVLPGQPFDVRTPSGHFALTDQDADFLDGAAVILIYRIPDAPPFTGTWAEFPPRYRVDVLPYTAQQNFDDETMPGYGPEDVRNGPASAIVSMCPNDPHPGEADDLRVLRNPEPFLEVGPHLLPGATGIILGCDQVPAYAVARDGRPAVGRLLAAGWDELRRAGSRALSLVAPATLHAVDGGAGGRAHLASDFAIVAAGEDLVLINDTNAFTDQHMANAGNQRLVRNLVAHDGGGARASGTIVLYDRGRSSPCYRNGECRDSAQSILDSVIEDEGYTIVKRNRTTSYASVPAGVRTILFFTPRVAFGAADVAGLQRFAREGGRIVFLGERLGFYRAAGLQVQNRFLADVGALSRVVGGEIDCDAPTLPAASLRAHPVTAGVTSVVVDCVSRVVPGPDDIPFLFDAANGRVVGAAAKISLAPLDLAHARRAPLAGPAPEASRATPATTTGGGGGGGGGAP